MECEETDLALWSSYLEDFWYFIETHTVQQIFYC